MALAHAERDALVVPHQQVRWTHAEMHGGDLETIDDQGYCSIVGRVKDMSIRGGENIYPRCAPVDGIGPWARNCSIRAGSDRGLLQPLDFSGTGTGIRTPVPWLRTTCPDP